LKLAILIIFKKNEMANEAIKLELIEWLTKLENIDTMRYLKFVKDSSIDNIDWWDDLSSSEKEGLKRGLKDIDEGRTTAHEEVKLKYGL
jgi:hypothetical protein